MTPIHRPRVALLAAPETSASVLYGLYDVLLSFGSRICLAPVPQEPGRRRRTSSWYEAAAMGQA